MDDDDDAGDDCEDGPALGPLANAIVATVVGGLVLMAITRVLIPRIVTVRQVPPQQAGQT